MGAPHTATPQITPGALAVPNGDASSVGTFRDLIDARIYLRGVAWGQLVWSGRMAVSGSATAPVITVGVIETVALRYPGDAASDATGVWRPYYTTGETTLGLAHVPSADKTGSPAALYADAWYYVYVGSDGTTTPQWEVSRTPPTESGTPTVARLWKRGQTSNWRYLGFFRTDGSGVPEPLRRVGGLTVFATPRLVVQNGPSGGTSNANLSVATAVPPHVHHLRARVAVATTGTSVIAVNAPGASASVGSSVNLVELYSDDAGLRYSAAVNGGESASLSLYVQSCQE
jgi:hypothetical protein